MSKKTLLNRVNKVTNRQKMITGSMVFCIAIVIGMLYLLYSSRMAPKNNVLSAMDAQIEAVSDVDLDAKSLDSLLE